MPNDAARFDAMLFDYKTTTNTDFKSLKFEPIVRSLYREKKRVRPQYKNVKDIRTLIEWNGPQMKFDLLWGAPKPIVRTDPRTVQQPSDPKPEDLGRKEAQRTRPRRVMTPAVSVDDIEDDDKRNMLLGDMYKSTAQIAAREGVALSKNNNVRAPFPGRNAPANPIFLKRLQPPRVPLEWRRETISWDYERLRTHVSPEREFWLRHGSLYKDCRSCKETAQIKKTRDMAKKLLPN